MNAPITPQSLIEQILQIQHMEHGSLSTIGKGPNGPYFNLNSWENDKNCCRYVPKDKIPAVQQAIEGYLCACPGKPSWRRGYASFDLTL